MGGLVFINHLGPALEDFIPNSLHNTIHRPRSSHKPSCESCSMEYLMFPRHFYCLDDTQWSKATMSGKDLKGNLSEKNILLSKKKKKKNGLKNSPLLICRVLNGLKRDTFSWVSEKHCAITPSGIICYILDLMFIILFPVCSEQNNPESNSLFVYPKQ